MNDSGARTGRDDDLPVTVMDGGPWGSGEEDGGDEQSRGNPWTQPARRRRPRVRMPAGQPSLEELIRRSRARLGGGGGGGRPGVARPIWGWALAAFVVLWLLTTSIHQVDPQERGVVTRFGRYVDTLGPGIGLTLPAPADVVTRVNVAQINSLDVPESGGQDLLLTGDGALVDLAYSVRWSVRDPERFLFNLAEPEGTVRQIAESAMREAVATAPLDGVTGSMRSQIEQRVAVRVQQILDRYRAGVTVQGIAIREANPPAAVADAFKDVPAAQAQAQTDLANARGYAEQVEANARGAAAAFDKVYGAYKLAPEVTRKRMYYETMEAVLGKNDKVIVDTPGMNTTLPLPLNRARGAAAAGRDDNAPATATPASGAGQ